jgi:hypothetical protein
MTAKLLFDGHYYSGPQKWTEWHAGVQMGGVSFYYWRFYESGDWISCYRSKDIPFWQFSQSVSQELFELARRGCSPRIEDADPLCTAGSYTIKGDLLTTSFIPEIGDGHVWQTTYRIHLDRLVFAENARAALLFKPAPP